MKLFPNAVYGTYSPGEKDGFFVFGGFGFADGADHSALGNNFTAAYTGVRHLAPLRSRFNPLRS